MTIEIEHEAGTSMEEIKHLEREAKKDALADAFGWTREEFDEKLEGIKDFLTDQEKNARKKGRSTVVVSPKDEE